MKKENNNVVVKNQVLLNLIQDLQRSLLSSINSMRGKCQIKFGMTALLNNNGFTLIELLVVVLIIGILAAVAVPQYEAAVVKSRVGTMLSLAASIAAAQEVYYLNHSSYSTNPADLDIELPSNCTIVSDSEYAYNCGKYFQLYFDPQGSININYCPDNTSTWNACKEKREIHIPFRLKHYSLYSAWAGKRYCTVYHNSKVGKAVCSSLSGFEYDENNG